MSAQRHRERHLTDAASSEAAFQHNTWDDVEWDAADLAAAERLVASQTPASDAAAAECTLHATRLWDSHYEANPRNYKDRRYLHNEFPQLLETRCGGGETTVLEIGCGAGNSLLPMLQANPAARGLACDLAPSAVELVRQRLLREGLTHRASAFVWDVACPPPAGALPVGGVDLILAVFTLSALSPEALPAALAQLHACLRPGGRLLLRDYGRLDLKHLKFAAVAGSRLPCGGGWDWHARGDGTTALFFTPELLAPLLDRAGFRVHEMRYDRRLAVNRATRERMYRVWLVAVLSKPAESPVAGEETVASPPPAPRCASRGPGRGWTRGDKPSAGKWALAVAISAVAAVLVLRRRRLS